MHRSIHAVYAAAFLTLVAPGLAIAQAAPTANVGQRFDNQQQRIDQGVASGQLTHHEAANDEHHLKADEAQRQRQRARDGGGKLTASQRAHDNARLNNNSNRIYQTKHNGKVAAPK